MFKDPRRIVTGHNPEGKSIVVADGPVRCETIKDGAGFAVLYETHEFPVSNEGWEDPILHRTKNLANSQGVVLRVVDIPAGAVSMFHRTESLDFGILHKGEVTCVLDDDVRVKMKEGDVCVQRGTIHGWINESSESARIYFILAAAHPVKFGDNILGNAGYVAEEMESGGDSH
ncbi:hypothetical protein NQ176_g1935 [Zarea fungicola]|uniref:Uncharacterized protein n=1 Tax=Zarea fungicola TaxID=93591 RepID=A0ACC1NRZ7_9HYPO|nr:hypothetical protein NQ176_g1935 [Lecanicillium fungicola]